MKIDNEALMFFHAMLNQEFFGGKLNPAIVKMAPGVRWKEDVHKATTYSGRYPTQIVFHTDVSDTEPLKVATVLLHEMVHQYCMENGISEEDSDSFGQEAARHGMTAGGYELTEEARSRLRPKLEGYGQMRDDIEKIILRELGLAEEIPVDPAELTASHPM